MGKSLTLRGTVDEARQLLKAHSLCKDPACDAHLWRARNDLDMAREEEEEAKRSRRITTH